MLSFYEPYDRGPAVLPGELHSGTESLSVERCLELHRLMVRSRVLEERMIKMSKSGEGYFWIGGPGEEAFSACLGAQVHKGCGPAYDYLYLHYRNSATLLAMGMDPLDGLRQMAMRRTDPHSAGRYFSNHFARRDWNVLPVSSVLGIKFSMAAGTALMQKRGSGDGVTIVVGGDAGTAEGDFASCLVWSTRPQQELPVLIVVTNNGWGISTSACSQHSESSVIDRGKPHGIPGEVVNGNDPVASWHAVRRGLDYCRRERKPYMIEALVSRLYGHSSSSGCQRVRNESDCIRDFEMQLLDAGLADAEALRRVHLDAEEEAEAAAEIALSEPHPTPEDVPVHTYAPSAVDAVYPDDYTGLPE
ncbi:MAG: thiamine pyrophosphate-dependent dehydrogenase E1 component subunit alpha [Planctomycetia bacterium]|nr:thiamine pyrophosphate-dependent dehydrogenase E1 component subunit alpha [Planctomycetia bacterium]